MMEHVHGTHGGMQGPIIYPSPHGSQIQRMLSGKLSLLIKGVCVHHVCPW